MLDKLKHSSFYYFIACASIIIGLVYQDFHKVPLTGGIIVLGIIWIGTFQFKEKIKTLFTKPFALCFIAFYLLHLASLVYSVNTTVAYNDLALKITLLLLPVFILSVSLFPQNKKLLLLHLFAISMVSMAVYDLYNSFLEYETSNSISVFYYKNLPHLLVGKPHYLAWYYSFAIFIALREIIVVKKARIAWTFASIILLFSLILLSSRAYLFAFLLIASISALVWISKKESSKGRLFKILGAFAILLGIIIAVPNTRERIADTFVELNNLVDSSDYRQTNPRVYIWKYSIELIAEKPILGYGIGDAKEELSKALKNCDALFWNGNKNVPLHRKSLNFHNQFLQTWAEVGILGFLLLLFLMIRPFYIKNQHPLFLIFVGLTLIGFLTESMLERQAGVVMFAFMYPLLSSLKK